VIGVAHPRLHDDVLELRVVDEVVDLSRAASMMG
jgi:hypothetical protein